MQSLEAKWLQSVIFLQSKIQLKMSCIFSSSVKVKQTEGEKKVSDLNVACWFAWK